MRTQNPRIETTSRRVRVTDHEDELARREHERGVRQVARGVVQRHAETRQVANVRAKLRASAAGHVEHAASIVGGRPDRHMAASEYDAFQRSVNSAVRALDQSEQLAQLEHPAVVVKEASPYGPDSPASWYADLAAQAAARVEQPDPSGLRSSEVDMSLAAVQERLRKHSVDVALAVQKGGEYGKRCKSILGEMWREEDVTAHRQRSEKELRAFGTKGGATASSAGGGGAAFVSPFFLLKQWAPYRSPIRTFADQCASYPIPPYGMECYIPTFSSIDEASLQAEEATVAEKVPATSFEGAQVKTATAQLLLTQQWRDRMNAGGGAFDELIAQEVNWRVDAEIGKYVINQALAGATVVTGNTPPYTEAGFWKDLATAREQLADTSGTRLRATSLFSTSDFYGFVTRQVDKTTERPVWPPWHVTPFPLVADTDDFRGPDWPSYARYMGTVMPGDLVWMVDEACPNYGTTTNTSIIVSAPAVAMVVVEGEGVTSVWPEYKPNELACLLNFRKFICAIARMAAGTAVIQGSAYGSSEK
jgi:hypothetical protein